MPTGGLAGKSALTTGSNRVLGRYEALHQAQAGYHKHQTLVVLGHLDIQINTAGGDSGCRTPRFDPNDSLQIDPNDIRCVLERRLLTTETPPRPW